MHAVRPEKGAPPVVPCVIAEALLTLKIRGELLSLSHAIAKSVCINKFAAEATGPGTASQLAMGWN